MYKICETCLQRLRKERRNLGLESWTLDLYIKAKLLINQGVPETPKLRKYVEFVDCFIPKIMFSTLDNYRGPLGELGRLTSTVKRIVEGYSRIISSTRLLGEMKKFKPLLDKVEKERKRKAQKLFEMRKSGKVPDVKTMGYEVLLLNLFHS
jgi:hypothetical protein